MLLTDRERGAPPLLTALRGRRRRLHPQERRRSELVRSLEVVHAGTTVIDPVLAGRTPARYAQQLSDESWPGMRQGLTHRERGVVDDGGRLCSWRRQPARGRRPRRRRPSPFHLISRASIDDRRCRRRSRRTGILV
ncbi:hypothetical protein HBB16_11515 [Pseudonocardia sp. MCCB 268]|nr:hypothetical protein [Pseudonocardia cytotoxica]